MTLVDVYYKYQKEYSEKYGNKTIVLMEVGSFYEMYATKEDSSYIKNVCDLLNILLTRKNKNIPVSPKNPYMGGIVSTSIDKYMRVLLEHNYTVVLVEQLNPNPPCKRAVTRICSPSTTISYLAEPARLNCLVVDGTKHIGMVSIDISTGTSYYHEVILPKNQYNSSWIIQEFVRFWSSLPCKEFLWYTVNELSDDSGSNSSRNTTSDKEMWMNATKWDKEPELLEHMSINQQNTILSKYYPDTKMLTPIEYLDMETSPLSVLAYIKAMQFEYEHDKLVTQYMAKPVKYDLSNTMNLAHHTISRLHLQSKEETSLLTIINKTKTALGKRLLEERLLHPSIDVDEINQRYDNIENMSDVSKDLQTAEYIVSSLGDAIPMNFLPAIIFVVAAITAFGSGSSWGVMAILMPLVIPLSWAVMENHGAANPENYHIMYSSVACVLTGAVWADHCSPISDTTILTSMASGCELMDHVWTQMPYAISAGLAALFLCTIPAGFGFPWWILLIAGIVSQILIVSFFGKKLISK